MQSAGAVQMFQICAGTGIIIRNAQAAKQQQACGQEQDNRQAAPKIAAQNRAGNLVKRMQADKTGVQDKSGSQAGRQNEKILRRNRQRQQKQREQRCEIEAQAGTVFVQKPFASQIKRCQRGNINQRFKKRGVRIVDKPAGHKTLVIKDNRSQQCRGYGYFADGKIGFRRGVLPESGRKQQNKHAAKKQKFGKHTDMVGKHHLNSHKPKRIDKGDDQQAGNQSQSDKHTFGQVHNAGGIRRYAAVVLKDIELLKQRSGHQNN